VVIVAIYNVMYVKALAELKTGERNEI